MDWTELVGFALENRTTTSDQQSQKSVLRRQPRWPTEMLLLGKWCIPARGVRVDAPRSLSVSAASDCTERASRLCVNSCVSRSVPFIRPAAGREGARDKQAAIYFSQSPALAQLGAGRGIGLSANLLSLQHGHGQGRSFLPNSSMLWCMPVLCQDPIFGPPDLPRCWLRPHWPSTEPLQVNLRRL